MDKIHYLIISIGILYSRFIEFGVMVLKMNVIRIIVKNDYCIGCGVCAGICPSNNLHMDWSEKEN